MSRVRSPSPAPSIYVKPSLIILTAHLARYNFEAAKESSRIKIQETPHVQKQLPHCFVREDSVSSLDVTNAPPGRIFLYLTVRNWKSIFAPGTCDVQFALPRPKLHGFFPRTR